MNICYHWQAQLSTMSKKPNILTQRTSVRISVFQAFLMDGKSSYLNSLYFPPIVLVLFLEGELCNQWYTLPRKGSPIDLMLTFPFTLDRTVVLNKYKPSIALRSRNPAGQQIPDFMIHTRQQIFLPPATIRTSFVNSQTSLHNPFSAHSNFSGTEEEEALQVS